MSENEQIHLAIQRTRRRRYLMRLWVGLWRALCVGAAVWAFGVTLFKLAPLPESFPTWALWAGSGVAALVWLPTFFRWPSVVETAQWVDERAQLKERLSTALERSESRKDDGEWTQLVMRDAASHAATVRPERLLPWTTPRIARWAVLLIVASVSLGFVPEYRSKRFNEEKQAEPFIEEAGREIAKVIRQQERKIALADPRAEEILEEAASFGEKLQSGTIGRSEALDEVSRMADRLKSETERLSSDPALQRMRQAARTPLQPQNQANAAVDAMKNMREQLGENPSDAGKKLAELQRQLDALKQKAESMNSGGAAPSEAAMAQMASAMAAAQEMAMEMGLELESLEAAMEALQNADIDQFLEDVGQATQDLEKLAELAKAMQNMQAELGKNLAEQLAKGQASIAKANIEAMKKTLDSGLNNATENLRMMAELSEAVGPANMYSEALKEAIDRASKELQNGNNQAASEALAEAAAELESLIDQAQAAQSLAEIFNAMKQGQLCMSQGMGFGQCPNPGLSPFGGASPGRGFGKIGDRSTPWTYQPYNGAPLPNVDGMELAGYEPEGITEREVAIPEDMQKERVKGQFSPGGQMPSVSMRNVFIRGESDVTFQAGTTAAAQSEESSAQNQDQIPKAYREAVRGYFAEE